MLKLFGRDVLILAGFENHMAVHDEAVVLAPRADGNYTPCFLREERAQAINERCRYIADLDCTRL